MNVRALSEHEGFAGFDDYFEQHLEAFEKIIK